MYCIAGFIFQHFFVLFWVTAPRLDNVTDDRCHSRIRSQIFPVPRSGIILTVCFVRKRILFDFLGFLRCWERPKSQKGPFPRKTNPWKMTPLLRTGQNPLDVSAEWQRCLVTLSKHGFRVRCWKKAYLMQTIQFASSGNFSWTWDVTVIFLSNHLV